MMYFGPWARRQVAFNVSFEVSLALVASFSIHSNDTLDDFRGMAVVTVKFFSAQSVRMIFSERTFINFRCLRNKSGIYAF